MRCWIEVLAIGAGMVMTAIPGSARSLAAQQGRGAGLALAASRTANPAGNRSSFVPPVGLAATYAVKLTSDWGRPGLVAACPVAGGETLEGVLTWTGQRYVGMLSRTTDVAECGAHGAAACRVRLVASGEVQAAAEPLGPAGTREVELVWAPARDTKVEVTGDCAPAYRDGLERLYRTVTHRVRFPVPAAGAGPVRLVLEDYAWAVEVE